MAAAAALSASLYHICVHVCAILLQFSSGFLLCLAIPLHSTLLARMHTDTNIHWHPPGIMAEKFLLSKKCPHFNLQSLQGPSPPSMFTVGDLKTNMRPMGLYYILI